MNNKIGIDWESPGNIEKNQIIHYGASAPDYYWRLRLQVA